MRPDPGLPCTPQKRNEQRRDQGLAPILLFDTGLWHYSRHPNCAWRCRCTAAMRYEAGQGRGQGRGEGGANAKV